MATAGPVFRRRLASDTPDVFGLFRRSLFDYLVRTGQIDRSDDLTTPAAVMDSWTLRSAWIEHLAATAAEDWVAEDADGRVIGWAQSIERDGMLELTKFLSARASHHAGSTAPSRPPDRSRRRRSG